MINRRILKRLLNAGMLSPHQSVFLSRLMVVSFKSTGKYGPLTGGSASAPSPAACPGMIRSPNKAAGASS